MITSLSDPRLANTYRFSFYEHPNLRGPRGKHLLDVYCASIEDAELAYDEAVAKKPAHRWIEVSLYHRNALKTALLSPISLVTITNNSTRNNKLIANIMNHIKKYSNTYAFVLAVIAALNVITALYGYAVGDAVIAVPTTLIAITTLWALIDYETKHAIPYDNKPTEQWADPTGKQIRWLQGTINTTSWKIKEHYIHVLTDHQLKTLLKHNERTIRLINTKLAMTRSPDDYKTLMNDMATQGANRHAILREMEYRFVASMR